MFRAELKLAIYDAKYVLTIHELKSLRHQCASHTTDGKYLQRAD